MVRSLNTVQIKKVIDALREEGPKGYVDLKNKLHIAEKSLTRILVDYLSYWGLVQKDEKTGLWQWYEEVKTYKTKHDYELALTHSKELVEGLNLLFMPDVESSWKENPQGLIERELSALAVAAREHLRTGYPEVYSETEKLQGLMNERSKLAKEIGKITGNKNPDVLLTSIGDYLLYGKYTRRWAMPERRFRHLEKLTKKLPNEKIEAISELKSAITETHLNLCSDIQRIEILIKMGEPLSGSCALCPKVRITEGESAR